MTEIQLLQSQLSPHFLFNTLNNLYAMSLLEGHRLPELLLKLSDMLRYSLYGTARTWVPLDSELNYIRDFIAFERIRLMDRLELVVDIDDRMNEHRMIAPMILIVFVENAFKHAKHSRNSQVYVNIAAKLYDDQLSLVVKNTFNTLTGSPQQIEPEPGIGIANTRKRLQLLYGKDFTLHQFIADNLFITELKIKLPGNV
jgi:LytS/YehU family sensor histidine kinase